MTKSTQMKNSIQIKIVYQLKVYEWKVHKWKRSIKIKMIQIKSIRMKSIRIESSIEWKTAFKCLFNKTKWKEHPTK